MNFFSISALVNFFTSVLLFWFVQRKSISKSQTSRTFCYFVLAVGFWSLAYFLWQISKTATNALLFTRVLMLGAIWIPSFFYHFITTLILSKPKLKEGLKYIYATSLIFSILNITPIFIASVKRVGNFDFWPIPGPAFHVFLAYFLSLTIVSHVLMWKEIRLVHDVKRSLQIKYVFLGTLIGFIGGSTNYFLFYDIPIKPYGNILVSLYVATVAYAIIRHQLMDIEFVVKRATVFAGLFIFVYATFSSFTYLGQRLFEGHVNIDPAFAMLPTISVIAIALRPIENVLIKITDTYLFQSKYDYRELLKMFTAEVLTILDIRQLTQKTVEGLNNIIKIETCAIALLNHETGEYEIKAGFGYDANDLKFTETSPIVFHLNMSHDYILRETDEKIVSNKLALQDDFKALKSELCVPIVLRDSLLGFISLGMKKSGDYYNQSEIDVLMSLARTEAIAISNAKLFTELSRTQAEAAQREKMAVIGTLAAGINHEICNPLGIARGQCEMFLLNYRDGLYKGKSDAELVGKLTIILNKVINEIDRATGITKRLSTFAKPPKKFVMGEVHIRTQVDEVFQILGHELKVDNINFTINIPPALPPVLGDKHQIQEVIFNIVRNAAQSIEGKGKIDISARRINRHIQIEITDTGSGIPQDKLGEVFNPFFTTKDPGKGTGLGLFIVKQIIERNKGTISVKSELGKGTKFTLAFKVMDELTKAETKGKA